MSTRPRHMDKRAAAARLSGNVRTDCIDCGRQHCVTWGWKGTRCIICRAVRVFGDNSLRRPNA